MATAEEQHEKQSVQDTQIPSMPIETITVKDVPDNSTHNINPLTTEDLKNILYQSTLQARLCENPLLVSVDELQKAVADITRDKVNTQEPSSAIPSTTSAQPLTQTLVDTSKKVETTDKVDSVEQQKTTREEENETTTEKIGQKDTSIPVAQIQGASQIIIIDHNRSE